MPSPDLENARFVLNSCRRSDHLFNKELIFDEDTLFKEGNFIMGHLVLVSKNNI